MRNYQNLSQYAARRYRIALDAMGELVASGRGDIPIAAFAKAIERLGLDQHQDYVEMLKDDLIQVENTVTKAIHIHNEGKS